MKLRLMRLNKNVEIIRKRDCLKNGNTYYALMNSELTFALKIPNIYHLQI